MSNDQDVPSDADPALALQSILRECASLGVCERRAAEGDYHEVVIDTAQAPQWEQVLMEWLGSPVKPAGLEPEPEHEQLACRYGGVRADQTLMTEDFGGQRVVAMLWPWQDATHVTLKIFLHPSVA